MRLVKLAVLELIVLFLAGVCFGQDFRAVKLPEDTAKKLASLKAVVDKDTSMLNAVTIETRKRHGDTMPYRGGCCFSSGTYVSSYTFKEVEIRGNYALVAMVVTYPDDKPYTNSFNVEELTPHEISILGKAKANLAEATAVHDAFEQGVKAGLGDTTTKTCYSGPKVTVEIRDTWALITTEPTKPSFDPGFVIQPGCGDHLLIGQPALTVIPDYAYITINADITTTEPNPKWNGKTWVCPEGYFWIITGTVHQGGLQEGDSTHITCAKTPAD